MRTCQATASFCESHGRAVLVLTGYVYRVSPAFEQLVVNVATCCQCGATVQCSASATCCCVGSYSGARVRHSLGATARVNPSTVWLGVMIGYDWPVVMLVRWWWWCYERPSAQMFPPSNSHARLANPALGRLQLQVPRPPPDAWLPSRRAYVDPGCCRCAAEVDSHICMCGNCCERDDDRQVCMRSRPWPRGCSAHVSIYRNST